MIVTYPMVNYNTESDKETGSRTDAVNNKPAVITIDVPGDDARTVEAQHCMRSDDGTLSIYLGPRSEGIDIQTHISRCVIDRVRWHAGREGVCSRCGKTAALGEDKKCQNCHHLACPGCDTGHVGGYEGAPTCTENCGFYSDDVDVRDKFDDEETISLFELKSVVGEWIASEIGQDPDTVQENPVPEMDGIVLRSGRHSVHMPFVGELDGLVDDVPFSAPVRTNSPVWEIEQATRVGHIVQDVQGHDRDESDPDIIADGGHDVPPCTRCGADLVSSVQMGTMKVGPRHGKASVTVEPTATCECGASVGANLGQRVVQALVDSLGDPRDDSELIADGGREIVNGATVLHAGEQWRVARVGVSDVEIYQLGNGSDIVPISTVEPVPEVRE